jgi:Flp pilus assembly pilin Flp
LLPTSSLLRVDSAPAVIQVAGLEGRNNAWRACASGCQAWFKDGQGVIEYALILLLVAMIVIIVLLTMGKQVQNIFSNVAAVLKRGG